MPTVHPARTPARRETGLAAWAAKDGHAWITRLVADVLDHRAEVTAERFEEVYAAFLAEEVDGVKPPPEVSTAAWVEPGDASDATLVLGSVGDTAAVNALAAGQSILFHENLTIVFGENGSGKSGYTRIIKRAANVRTAEEILPNVRRPAGATVPSATIRYRLGSIDHELRWESEIGVAPLTRIDVFDSRCTPLHIDRELPYAYTPGELACFTLVQRALERARDRLCAERKALQAKPNPFVEKFHGDSRAGALVAALGTSTLDADVSKLAALSEDDRRQMEVHRDAAMRLAAASTVAEVGLLRGDRQLLARAINLLRLVAAFDLAAYEAARAGRNAAALARAQRVGEAVLRAPSPIAPSEEWRAFAQAAEAFLATTDRAARYPESGDHCIYCAQVLTGPAAEFVARVRALASGAAEQACEEAGRRLGDRQSEFLLVDLDPLIRELEQRSVDAASRPSLSALLSVRPLLARIDTARVLVQGGEVATDDALLTDAQAAADALERAQADLDALAAALQSSDEVRETKRREHEAGVREMEDRERLATLLPEVTRHLAELRWAEQANRVEARFRGLLKTLTEAAKARGDELMNQRFSDRFASECAALLVPPVELTFPGREGAVKREKHVSGYHAPGKVLSEGEQKVLALADFLAEVSLKSPAPVLFDDPVNSLDARRMGRVTDRLVALTAERQVIVFTHNVMFVSELLDRVGKPKGRFVYYEVENDGGQPGVILKLESPRSDSPKYLLKTVEGLIQQAEKEPAGAQRRLLVGSAYDHLRALCESVVECELFGDVVRRFRRNAMITKLGQLPYSRMEEAGHALEALHAKLCGIVKAHAQPDDALGVRYGLTDVKTDLATLAAIRSAIRGKVEA